eukprot:7011532-Prymnesium_polylepis.3
MAHTSCTCKYKGTLTPVNGGKQCDAGEIDFAPNQVIKGWTEAMQLMKEGDRWELYIPSDLAYGSAGAGADIPGGAALGLHDGDQEGARQKDGQGLQAL